MTSPHSWDGDRGRAIAIPLALALVLGMIVAAVISNADETGFGPVERSSPVVDLLGWIPATESSLRRFSAWAAEPGDPLNLTESLDALGLDPRPLATGRSAEWQSATGMEASQVTGWASAPNEGVSVLVGTFDAAGIVTALRASGYERAAGSDIAVWLAPDGVASGRVIAGDDLRALRAIAVYGDRLIIGFDVDAIARALDAAAGLRESLADSDAAEQIVSDLTAGLMVVDQRDLSIGCGFAGQWTEQDFAQPSGMAVAVVYQRGADPVTSVWVQYPDDLSALAGLTALEREWEDGYLYQQGVTARVPDFGSVRSVQAVGQFVVADLVRGRDNGWTRSGVRFLIGVCEQASSLIPVGAPERATPVASPSPMEQP